MLSWYNNVISYLTAKSLSCEFIYNDILINLTITISPNVIGV